ncbi:DNA-directed RNA polymerase III subunit RPC7-like [Teleopsis dalmanni]|uniref:DNA-directed RNA polymerase III subunit RPC7-like n=1 Tax=Teleopsis dalmanni TaxID=139649 RepID=UPI0018CDDCA1|nr:DNA-directed RNA polymerase III subunit RPC7-like [Teleopsis dalmanni]
MAGRGRGGKTGTLTQDQINKMGIGTEMPIQTAPPPTYPQLLSKPVTMEITSAQSYQILWKEDFLNHMRDSPYFLLPKVNTKLNMQRQVDQLVAALEDSKMKTKPDFNWQLLPPELHLTGKRRIATADKNVPTKKLKTENIEDRLKLLEEKERTEGDKDLLDKANSESEVEDEEEVAADEEMDDENDYGNSYFDNGEAYNEEDDNLDDGPVY